MRIIALTIAIILVLGCGHKAAYYHVEVDGGYTYWREYHKTTFHGLCANLYGSDATGWEVDHPTGSVPDPSGSKEMVSAHDETRIFKTKAEGAAWAESVCPTK